jgi:hypothetical protein
MVSNHGPEMQDEYDLSHGIRGKYAARYREGENLVKLDDDVASMFPDERSVKEALRAHLRTAAAPFSGSGLPCSRILRSGDAATHVQLRSANAYPALR